MGILLIRCPHSARPVSTGIEVNSDALAALPDTLSYLSCPDCGLRHAWWRREAWLEEAVEVAPPADGFSIGKQDVSAHRGDGEATKGIWLNGNKDFRNGRFAETLAGERDAIRKLVASVQRTSASLRKSLAQIAESRAVLDGGADREGAVKKRSSNRV